MRHFARGLLIASLMWSAGYASASTPGQLLPQPQAELFGVHDTVITVIEPHRSTPLKPVAVSYQGFPASTALDGLLGEAWRAQGAVVGFEAVDGYLSMIPAEHLLRYPAYLVYAQANGNAFSVETPPLNDRVMLGPWYLVWDNLSAPQLQADGATYWPYQVERVRVIDVATQSKIQPADLPARYRDGAILTEKYCLSCHQLNGVGGHKMPIDLGQWAANQSVARFATWVLDPSDKNPLTTMPAFASERPASERQLMARQIYGYLRYLGTKRP